jgi:hypothetical protein
VSTLVVSAPTADGGERLRLEQRGRVGRLNGCTSNLQAPTRTASYPPQPKPENQEPSYKTSALQPAQGWRGTRQASPGQISVSVLQLYILITMPQLTLHASVANLILLVLLHRALTPILIFRFVHGCFLLLNYGPQHG